MRRLMLITTAALAVLAVSATPALADYSHFPYDDFATANWNAPAGEVVHTSHGEACDGCQFEVEDDDNGWTTISVDSQGSVGAGGTCTGGGWTGSIDAQGNVGVTSFAFGSGGMGSLCWLPAAQLPWEASSICYHAPSGELWLRLAGTINDGSNDRSFVTYGKLVGQATSGVLEVQGVEFDDPSSSSGSYTDFGVIGISGQLIHTVELDVTSPTFSVPVGTGDPCGWPELT